MDAPAVRAREPWRPSTGDHGGRHDDDGHDSGRYHDDDDNNNDGHRHRHDALVPLAPYRAGQPKSLSGIALRAFCLGLVAAAVAAAAVATAFFTDSPAWRLPAFALALAVFHFLEFWTTAAANTPVACIDSFLLTANWPAYALAHAAASAECLVVCAAFPRRAWAPPPLAAALPAVGAALVLAGQAIRSLAMLQAGESFNHHVQMNRKASHALVTRGLYARMRHPSYFGFFYWALGTQLVLGNVVCFFAYAAVLWTFFRSRIAVEERALVSFFGDDYVRYRASVGTKIPLIP